MLAEEAAWLGARIRERRNEELFPFLNVGSSTETFRTCTQPYIEREIFAPLRRRGGPILHLDIKHAPGVDLVGDLMDPEFLSRVRETVTPRCVLVSNLLEHVPDPVKVAQRVASLVPPGGLILVSGPHAYPYHPDPLDNLFRPHLEEARSLFDPVIPVQEQIIESPSWRPWTGTSRSALLFLSRLAVPFYRPRAWRRRMDSFPFLFRRASAYALVLEKATLPTA